MKTLTEKLFTYIYIVVGIVFIVAGIALTVSTVQEVIDRHDKRKLFEEATERMVQSVEDYNPAGVCNEKSKRSH